MTATDARSLAAPLRGKVALVAGATRGAGRAIALELGVAGALVYVTGRSVRGQPSPLQRPETIEETAELIEQAGGSAIALRVDHTQPEQVVGLIERIGREQNGRLDILVNDIWGADPLAQWHTPFWTHNLDNGLRMQRLAVDTHLITAWHAAPLMIARRSGLIVEVTDGVDAGYRGSLFYDLAKSAVLRLALAFSEELRSFGVTAVAVSPGFLRSEAMLDHFGVTPESWRDAIHQDPHFVASETPRFLGRGLAALAADPELAAQSGKAFGSWDLARKYGITDTDGSRPDWGTYYRKVVLDSSAA